VAVVNLALPPGFRFPVQVMPPVDVWIAPASPSATPKLKLLAAVARMPVSEVLARSEPAVRAARKVAGSIANRVEGALNRAARFLKYVVIFVQLVGPVRAVADGVQFEGDLFDVRFPTDFAGFLGVVEFPLQ
jgi:hypothetical protein